MLLQIPAILDAGELEELRRAMQGARFEDGTATASPGAHSVKRNLQLPQESEAARACAGVVLKAVRRSPIFFSASLPKRTIGPLFNRYDVGMAYGDHMDSATMQLASVVRADIAATLFLSAPEDYDGGELVIQDSFGAHRVKLPAGSIIVYPASSMHRVEPVTRGSRLAAVLWVESLVREEARRRILFDLDLAIGKLAAKSPRPPEVESLGTVYHNLLRMWAET